MNYQEKKQLKHQLRKRTAINFVATASSVGMLGVVATQAPSVRAETLESLSAIVTENEVESKVTIVEDESAVVSVIGIETEPSIAPLPTAEEIVSEFVSETAKTVSIHEEKMEDKATNERIAGITYKIVYTDIGTNTIVKSEHKTVSVTTTDEIATAEVTEVAKIPVGYKLSENQSIGITETLVEKQQNVINFTVVADSESVVSVNEGMSFRSETDNANNKPYGTIENYTRSINYIKNGETVDILYKIGLTRIRPDEVELSADAALLGLTFDEEALYIKGSIALTSEIEARMYNIGLVSKADKAVIVNTQISIQDTLGFVLRPMGESSQYMYARDIIRRAYSWSYPISVDNQVFESEVREREKEWRYVQGVAQSVNELTYNLSVPVTPFGYLLSAGTIENVDENTDQYFAEIPLVSLDSISDLNNKQQKITRFEQLSGQDIGIELEFIDLRKKTGKEMGFTTDLLTDAEKSLPGSGLRWSPHPYDENATSDETSSGKYLVTTHASRYSALTYTPYYLRFKKLPELKGNYIVSFKITDTTGREKTITLNIETYERSISGSLTHADVKFDGEAEYYNAAENLVQVKPSADAQILGVLTLNKKNATISTLSLPEGVEVNNQNQVIKKAGIQLKPGVYTMTAKAIDGHFGDAAPVRTFKFEVVDTIRPIGHQQWEEGKQISPVPISLVGGTAIKSLRIETDKVHTLLEGDNINSQIVGFGIKRTEKQGTATVYATYVNSEGEDTTVSTIFTYEVQLAQNSNLDLEVTNDNQTIHEGENFMDMQITFTEGATIKVDTDKLPKGTSYDSLTHTISGKGLYEGNYLIPITAEKEGKSRTIFVNLTVLLGNLTVEPMEVTIPVLEAWSYKLNVPDNISVSGLYSLPSGITYDNHTKTLHGTPTTVGTYYNNVYYSRPKGENGTERTYASFTIIVKDKVASLAVEDRTVQVLSEMSPIQLVASEGATISFESSLPPGLHFDDGTKTIMGTPTKVGNYIITARATYPGIQNSLGISKTFRITVDALPATLSVLPENQTINLGNALTDVVVVTNPEATVVLDTVFGELTGDRINEYVKNQYGISYNPLIKTFSGIPNRSGIFELSLKARNSGDLGGNMTTTIFSFNVMDEELELSLTNAYQSLPKGRSIRESIISHTVGSNLEIDRASIPEGIIYHEDSKTFSGIPTKAGNYQITMTATSPKGTKTKKATLTIDVFELPEEPKEKTADPIIDKMIEGDTRVSGIGVVGAVIEVRLPDGSLKTTLVLENGTWQIDPVPVFEKGQTVTVKQKENGKLLSDAINSTTVARITKGDKGDPGVPGMNGADGKSVIIDKVEKTAEGNTKIIFSEGTVVIVPKGDKGDPGVPGMNGADGKSVTIDKVEKTEEGNTKIIFSEGTVVTVPKGDKGDPGVPGMNGADGKSVTIDKVEKTEEGNTKIIFSDGTVVTVPKGDKGDPGVPGMNGIDGGKGTDGESGQDDESSKGNVSGQDDESSKGNVSGTDGESRKDSEPNEDGIQSLGDNGIVASNHQRLPNTGEDSTLLLISLGLATMGIAGDLYNRKRKED